MSYLGEILPPLEDPPDNYLLDLGDLDLDTVTQLPGAHKGHRYRLIGTSTTNQLGTGSALRAGDIVACLVDNTAVNTPANWYTETSASGNGPADTDDLAEGATNLYHTNARVSANSTVVGNTAAAAAANALAATKMTEAQGDARYVEVTGDTMNGALAISAVSPYVTITGSATAGTVVEAPYVFERFQDTDATSGSRAFMIQPTGGNYALYSTDDAYGTPVRLFSVTHGGGIWIGAATGGPKELGSINASQYYQDNVALSDKYVDVAGDTMTGNLNIFPAAGTSQVQLSGTQARVRCIDTDYGVAADAGCEYLTANGSTGRRVINVSGTVARNVDLIRHSDAAMTLGAATGGFMGDSAFNAKAYFIDGQEIGMRPIPASTLVSSVGNRAAINVNLTGAPPNATGVLLRAVATGTGAQSGKVQLGQGRRTLSQPENWPVLFIKSSGTTTIPYTVTDATAGFSVDVELLGYYL